jgi:hypothetical protein
MSNPNHPPTDVGQPTTASPRDGEPQRPFRVLSLDGGGIRGLYTASLLKTLAARFQAQRKPQQRPQAPELDIGKVFDLIVGTSTGGILAIAMVFGHPVSKIVNLYNNWGPSIFTRPQPSSRIALLKWMASCLGKPADSPLPLRTALVNLFGKKTVKEVYDERHIAFCLTAVKLIDEKFRVFKTPHIPKKNMDDTYQLVDICMATSAAPIFFPLVRIRLPSHDSYEVFADGGLAANKPVLISLIEALQMAKPNQPIHIHSISTCPRPPGTLLGEKDLGRGILKWGAGTKALTLSMNAQASGALYSAQFLASWLTANTNREVKVIPYPEGTRSPEQVQYLQMDLASPSALQALAKFGELDAIPIFTLCQDANSETGRIISDAFNAMPELLVTAR